MGIISDELLGTNEVYLGERDSQNIQGAQYFDNMKRFQVGSGGTPSVRMTDGAMYVNDGTNDRVLIGYKEDRF